MALMRWDPFRELDEVRSRFGRFIPMKSDRPLNEEEYFFADWSPATDVQETDADFVIKTDLPAVAKENVKVFVQNGVLTIEGERKREEETEGKRFHKIEREYGKFVRRFALPLETDAARVQAEFKDGVLSVHVPKAQKIAPKPVDVKVA